MTLYLSYEEYRDLGGIVSDEDAYTKIARKGQHLLDYITFNRIPLLPEIPEVVKDVMVEFVDKMYEFGSSATTEDAGSGNVSSYSNTVEKITYKVVTDSERSNQLIKDIAYRYLPDYLTARGVSFDVEKYLQSEGHHT